MSDHRRRALPFLVVLPCLLGEQAPGDNSPRLAMTPAIVCRAVAGYEDYERLPEPIMYANEKMLVYYRPQHYTILREKDGGYLAHFVQEARVRRRGEKAVLWSKARVVDYKARSPRPPREVYLTNSIALRGFKPGEYDLDIILRDALAEEETATQVLRFRIVESIDAEPKTKGDSEDGPPDRP